MTQFFYILPTDMNFSFFLDDIKVNAVKIF